MRIWGASKRRWPAVTLISAGLAVVATAAAGCGSSSGGSGSSASVVKGSREDLREATGSTKLPTLKLADGTVIANSRAILSWVDQQK